MSPEERARRIKYNIPDDPAKRALTPEQQAAIARLTGTQPGGPAERYGRSHAAPSRAARGAPPPERVRPQAAPESASVRERPVANRPAAERPVAERPVADGPAERPVANRPGTDRTAANHPGTDQPGTERSENRGPADARPDRDTHEAPVDSGDLQATIADLRRQLADSKSEVQAEKAHSADLETRNAGLATEVADLKTRVAERDGKLAEQATDIGALKETAGKHEAAIGELLGRVARMESAGADGPGRGVDQRESPQPEVHEASDGARDGTQSPPTDWVDDRASVGDVRGNRKSLTEKARYVAGTATDAALTGAGLAGPVLSIFGADMPATYAGGGVTAATFIVGIVRVVKKWRSGTQ